MSMFSYLDGSGAEPPQCAGLGQPVLWGAGAAMAAAKRAEATVKNCILMYVWVEVGWL